MGLFDKVKNMFTEEVEEEEVEVKVEQIKKEVTHVPIESPNAFEEEVVEEKEEKTKGAVFFADRDFEDLVKPRHVQPQSRNDEYFSKEELAKMYGSNNNKTQKPEKVEKVFKPTPIISPVYGILDKNYHKEDIVERKETSYKPATNTVTVDTVRNKAYGTLEEQLKDEVLNGKREKHEEVDLFEELAQEKAALVFEDEKTTTQDELTMDLTKELDNLLQKKQTSINEIKTREEKNKNVGNSDLFNLIDTMYEEGKDN